MDILGKLNINEKSILFQYNLEPHDIDEDNVQCVVVDNKKNFLEIDSEKIVSSYHFPFSINKVQRITVFYSYQPKFKYYLILFDRFMIVLKKTKDLNFVERINDVSHYYISDYYDNGRPQVVICLIGKPHPLVTDFSQETGEPTVTLESDNRVLYGLNLTVISQLQSLNGRLKDAEKKLEEKNSLVSKLTCDMVCNSKVSGNVMCNAQILLDSPSTSTVKCEPISVGVPWVRSYLDKWIIGFPVSNLQDKPISKIRVFIFKTAISVEKTVLFVPKVKTLEGSEFTTAHILEGHKIGIVAAVIHEPVIMNSSISFSCSASFICGYENYMKQVNLGEITVTTDHILSNKLVPFRTSKSFRDIIAYLTVSTNTKLYLKNPENKQLFLNNLKDNYGFIHVTDRYTVNIMENSVFTGVLVGVETNFYGCTVDFYTKDYRQLTLLLQCLQKYQFETPHFMMRPEPDLRVLHKSMKEELGAVKTVVCAPSQTLHPNYVNDDPLQALKYLNVYESKTYQNICNN